MSITIMTLPDTHVELAALFTKLLTVAIHRIIPVRSTVYPRVTFLPVRAYSLGINDVAAAVKTRR